MPSFRGQHEPENGRLQIVSRHRAGTTLDVASENRRRSMPRPRYGAALQQHLAGGNVSISISPSQRCDLAWRECPLDDSTTDGPLDSLRSLVPVRFPQVAKDQPTRGDCVVRPVRPSTAMGGLPVACLMCEHLCAPWRPRVTPGTSRCAGRPTVSPIAARRSIQMELE